MTQLVRKDTALSKINFNLEDYKEQFEKYDKDLVDYINTFSGEKSEYIGYAKRVLLAKLEEKWQPILNFNSTRISQDIAEKQAPKLKVPNSMSLKDVLSYDDGESDWLIPNLLSTAGLYILAGVPKTGKTVLVNFLIYGVSVSGEFLGKPVQTGNVLYIQLEEPIRTMKKRALMAGFGNTSDEETSLVINFSDRVRIEKSFDLSNDITWLIKKIKEHNPKLVVIDSIRAASTSSDSSENSNEFGKLMYVLQRAIAHSDTCCVVIHHMNKTQGKNVDLIQRLSGHSSISGACDGIIGLTSEESDGGKVIALRTKPRDGTEITIFYKLLQNNETGFYYLDKVYEDNQANEVYTSKIIRFLAKTPDVYYNAKDIAAGIEVDRLNKDFSDALDYLNKSEMIKSKYSVKSVMYCLASNSLWMINPQRVKDIVNPSVLDANAMMQCVDKSSLRTLLKDWDKEREAKALTLLFDAEKKRVKDIVTQWEYKEGDLVVYNGKVHTVSSRNSEKSTLRKNKYVLEGVENSVLEQDLFLVTDVEFNTEKKTLVEIQEEANTYLLDNELEDDEPLIDL